MANKRCGSWYRREGLTAATGGKQAKSLWWKELCHSVHSPWRQPWLSPDQHCASAFFQRKICKISIGQVFSKGCVTTVFLDIPDICPHDSISSWIFLSIVPLLSKVCTCVGHGCDHVAHLTGPLLQAHEACLVGTTGPAVLTFHLPLSRDFLLQERGHLILHKYLQGGPLPRLDPRYASFATSGNLVTGSGD